MELGWLTVSSQARLILFGQVPADPLYSSAPGTDQQSCGDGQSDMWTIKSHCYTPRRFCGWRVHSSGVTPWTMLTRCLFGYAINPKTCWNMVSPTKLGILQTLRKRVVIVVGVACMLLDYLWPNWVHCNNSLFHSARFWQPCLPRHSLKFKYESKKTPNVMIHIKSHQSFRSYST